MNKAVQIAGCADSVGPEIPVGTSGDAEILPPPRQKFRLLKRISIHAGPKTDTRGFLGLWNLTKVDSPSFAPRNSRFFPSVTPTKLATQILFVACSARRKCGVPWGDRRARRTVPSSAAATAIYKCTRRALQFNRHFAVIDSNGRDLPLKRDQRKLERRKTPGRLVLKVEAVLLHDDTRSDGTAR